MNRYLLLLLVVGALAINGPAGAQSGDVYLFADAAFTQCNVVGAAGLLTVYVVHYGTPSAISVRYALSDNTGGALSYLAEQNQFTQVTGDSQSGIAVSYGGCVPSPIHVQNVLYQVLTEPSPCTGVKVVPDPSTPSGQIESVDCSAVTRFPIDWPLTFDGDTSCSCGSLAGPAETATWGRVKGLYR